MSARQPAASLRPLDAVVLDAVRYNRYRGVSGADLRPYVAARHRGDTSRAVLERSLARLQAADQVVQVGKRWLLHPDVFATARGDARPPEFRGEDTWILATLLTYADAGPRGLTEIVAAADVINKAIPTLDELHGALNRLHAARLIAVRKGEYQATDAALELWAKVRANCRGGWSEKLEGLANLLRCPCCGIRLGRVTWRIDITREVLDAAVDRYLRKVR